MFTIFLTEIQPVCLHFGKIEKSINKGKKNSKNNFWASNFYDKLIFNSFGPKNENTKIPINFLITYLLVNQQTADLLLFQRNNKHSSVLELRKNQFLKKINVLKTFLEIETTHYLEGLYLKLNNETYAKVLNL